MESRHFKTPERVSVPSQMRLVFAIIMIIVYVGAGLMLLFNWFNVIHDPDWNWLRWFGGPIFILYGLFRAYRYFIGLDTNDQNTQN
jgi:phosphoglycerol transferase MdoB-like AlkP superfamily enzyme